MHGVALDSYCK